jgi:hypothetical protein
MTGRRGGQSPATRPDSGRPKTAPNHPGRRYSSHSGNSEARPFYHRSPGRQDERASRIKPERAQQFTNDS